MIFIDSNTPIGTWLERHIHTKLKRSSSWSVWLRRVRTGEIVQSRAMISSRDAIHIAVMERHGIRSILSFDGDFDRWPGLQRIHRV